LNEVLFVANGSLQSRHGFDNWTPLQRIRFREGDGCRQDWLPRMYFTSPRRVRTEESARQIDGFRDYPALERINIPPSIEAIDLSRFQDCRKSNSSEVLA
jgi:hypothetical protein